MVCYQSGQDQQYEMPVQKLASRCQLHLYCRPASLLLESATDVNMVALAGDGVVWPSGRLSFRSAPPPASSSVLARAGPACSRRNVARKPISNDRSIAQTNS